MSITDVRDNLVARLDQGDRGDRGWFIVTRVHVDLSWLRGIAQYLAHRARHGIVSLTNEDYDQLAIIVGVQRSDPGVQLRRHHLLVMDKPLRLLQRLDGQRWRRIALTESGNELAQAGDPAVVIEQSLSAMRFAVEPWSPPTRVAQYEEFDVGVYNVTRHILDNCNGYIDRDEFDFFVSRIRTEEEISWAEEAIRAYRSLTEEERQTLHAEVRSRIPTAKTYLNWRDIGLHTFSLFSLGTSMIRHDTRLLLTPAWAGVHPSYDKPGAFIGTRSPKLARVAEPSLRLPEPPEAEALLTPPVGPAANDGADAESFVAKILRSQGWQVAFYTNRRGYGFDLWATRENRAMLVEVKSSVGTLGAVTLTPTEYEAARRHEDCYYLALVEEVHSASPMVSIIQNPVANLEIRKRSTFAYMIPRAEWQKATRGAPGSGE